MGCWHRLTMLLGAGCSVLSAACSLWNLMVGAEGAAFAARASSRCARVQQQGHGPGGRCKQGCGQAAGSRAWHPSASPILPGLAESFFRAGSSNSLSLAAFANGAGPGRGLQHVGCSSSAVFPGASGCHRTLRGLPSAWGDRQHLVTGTCRSAFLNDELCLSVPSISSAVPAH